LRVFIQVGPQRRLLAVKSPVTKLKFKRLAPDEGRPPKTKETFLSSDEPARGQTRDKIGSFASVSGRTVEKIAAVVKAAAESPQGRLDRDLVAGLYARAAPRLAKGS
jgi:hypothetical protein